MGKQKTHSSPGSAESHTEPKEKQPKKHINQTDKKLSSKKKNVKSIKGKATTNIKMNPQKVSNFSTATLQARREWCDIFKVVKKKNLQSRLLHPSSISFRFDGEIKVS